MKLKHLISSVALVCALPMAAAPVKVTMNAISTTMTLAEKNSGTAVDVGSPSNKVYTFDAPAGDYVLTAYATNGKTVNGTIVLTVADSSDEQAFTVITPTVYVSNKNAHGSTWTVENGDYTLDVTVNTREGVRQTVTVGNSTTAGRYTFLTFNGNSYNVAIIPSEAHQAEGYTTLYKGGTLTGNINVFGAIPKAADYSISLPADAELVIGLKFTHFTDFTPVKPKSTEIKGDTKTVTYSLADAQVYNYRTWMKDGLTQAGYFTMSIDRSKRPAINFTKADYEAYNPHQINHDPQSNKGYETGNIFVNINHQGHLRLNVGDSFDAHAMRTWELSDNSTNNYFMEPDFHYTVVGLDGKPSAGVVEITTNETNPSAWSKIKAVGKGTAIIMVTYDAIGLNYYSGVNKSEYLGGEYWGAIWPENTGVYVVTVCEDASGIKPNMLINQEYNKETLKLAGYNVDAEHDVFYYLDTEEGATYTFTPEGVDNITIAYPTIGERTVTYSGFGSEGVTKNDDGSYTLLLKHGRQIVKLTDVAGKSAYQVLTAKECHREIINDTRSGSKIFQPGDKVKIQYSGLYHPANKIAGIYNMSAYVTYNGIPNGSSLILGSGQYIFGSAASAQAVTVTIPDDYDVNASPEIVMDKGVIQVNGYGDPIGNHRNISPLAGRSPNFTAVAHKTYFGAIPDVRLPISSFRDFSIKLKVNVEDADIKVMFNDKELTPDENGDYSGTYGTYNVDALKDGYCYYHKAFTIGDDADGTQTFNIKMTELGDAWDGKTLTEPSVENGVYLIAKGSELAWLAYHVNEGNATANARLTQDINLGGFPWTPIGNSSAKTFSGNFDGQGHEVKGLYIYAPTATYQALFGYLKSGSIANLTVSGSVSAKQYVGGVVANIQADATVDRCVNLADVKGTGTYVGGVAANANNATAKITNSYNAGHVTGTTNCGGVAGYNNANTVIENVFNVGEITSTTAGACVGGTTAKNNVKNAFATEKYGITTGQTTVTEEQMRSGEVAYLLGEAFGQLIGTDEQPVIGGEKVFYNEGTKTYYNEAYPVTVKMNAVSTTMSMTMKDSGKTIAVGEPNKQDYTFNAPAGEYILTAYGKDGVTVNGTIVVNVDKQEEMQEFMILTNTVYVTNKHNDGSVWTVKDGDFSLDVTVNTREGKRQTISIGESTTAGRNTFLAFNGNSYTVAFIPSEAHQSEGYTTLYKAGTLTFNVNVNGKITMAADYSISLPTEAELMIGLKFTHFTDFTPVQPKSTEINGDIKTMTYSLADAQVYNYRTWMKDGLTQAGYFTMNIDESKRPDINFTKADYEAFSPNTINYSAQSNKGFETGDIFVNINPEGHLRLNAGDTFEAHAMRTWQLTDNSTNNYFMEPDFHYTVVDLDGKPSADVIEINNANTSVSPWSQIKAIGKGTAIVLVTYDAIGVNYYSATKKTEYLGGEYWGAIWPENTAVYVVTVGEEVGGISPNMTINEEYNLDAKRLAGKYVDAEHDVFYYLDTEAGAYYTFTPEGVDNVTIAYPTIGERTVTYNGFGTEGVTKNDDGSFTLLLKHGRQIVRLTNEAGESVYQVLTAKECQRDIVNVSREDATDFRPGDKIEIRYSGLYHPANRLSGIYNMSAYVTYNGIPNGTSLILSANQYTFGSSAKAQTVTLEIPEDYDAINEPDFVLDNGVIQVNGYGDPIGNHRNISPLAGRSPNFTAIAHKTYFGMIPEVHIPVTPKGGVISGIEDVTIDNDEDVMYYNLQGVASDRPFKGVNIVRKAEGTTSKMYIK